MAILYIMMGAPGSGKSTFIKNYIDYKIERYVSRDEIRFSMVKEDEDYFSKENEVFKKFTSEINNALNLGINVYADATHLNTASRNKLINAIKEKPSSIEVIFINTSLNKCLEQNENRKGTRSYVPREVIKRMYLSIEPPTFEEGFSTIYEIKENEKIEIRRNL